MEVVDNIEVSDTDAMIAVLMVVVFIVLALVAIAVDDISRYHQRIV